MVQCPPRHDEGNVPTPIFKPDGGATVDERNNWINISCARHSSNDQIVHGCRARQLLVGIEFAGDRLITPATPLTTYAQAAAG